MVARHLDVDALVITARRLASRIGDRFPGRGINSVAAELVAVTEESRACVESIRRPMWGVRLGVLAVMSLAGLLLVLSLTRVRLDADVEGLDGWLGLVESGIQDVVFLGIGALFLVGIEARRKRRRALAALHELRSLIHVIDMHQLTKDPDTLLNPERDTAHSPRRHMTRGELARYLDYCSELVAIASKVAALYAQSSQDAVVLDVVREIQDLGSGLSNKVWQKIVILDTPDPVPTGLRHN